MKKTEINQAVIGDYERYSRIKTTRKWIGNSALTWKKSKTHASNQIGEANVLFDQGVENGLLGVDINVKRTKTFRFRLSCEGFMKAPCYRFDSDGSAHENPPSPDCPLRQRVVPTPHFHRYDEKGHNIAYRTPELEAAGNGILQNVHQTFALFCKEENLDVPTLSFQTDLFEKCEYNDPLEGVQFP